MTKIAVNRNSGSFRLSPQIVQRMCELKGIPCYFFDKVYVNPELDSDDYTEKYIPKTVDTCNDSFWAYTIPNPDEVFPDNWDTLSDEERDIRNAKFDECDIDVWFITYGGNDSIRTNPILIQAIEEVGHKSIEIIEIPDDVEWYIWESENGYESIHERHRIW